MVVVVVFVVVILLRSAALIALMLFVAEVVSFSLFRARKRMKKFVDELENFRGVFVTTKYDQRRRTTHGSRRRRPERQVRAERIQFPRPRFKYRFGKKPI